MVTAAHSFEHIFTAAPSVDFAALLVGDDVKRLEKAVDQFEIAAATWRANAISRLSNLERFPVVSGQAVGEPLAPSGVGALSAAMKAVEEGIEAFSKPLHSNSGVAQKIEQIAKLSASTGRFVRKLLRRIEKIRVAQHAAHVDIYYGLLALHSELEQTKPTESFSDPEKLGAFLRSQLA
ncbi:hypothetical protein HNR60_001267 [Rhodopseudomonas rhenobacensis]|uniref:Uncharacterized protein n=1 Tax=Rhodopseudomonas rhenobacensis TaxID=87461 RepID=A0A7W7Z223_9BRAD|nr:hypothetical protein [Rhodopseudomonas rhenobacensis]MBB5046522.1 hypothetical protein [Rhodopseudomonas rhenobacensis]